jgi:glutamate receptor, ionotropic, plant
VGTISGTGSLTFDSFAGLIIATGVASTISLVIALIIHFCKSKKVDSEQILQQEETKDGLNEKNQCQEEDRGKGMHEQLKTVMRYGSLVIYRGPRIPSLSISSSARF